MAELRTATFTASIDNEDALNRWLESIQEAAQRANLALEDLSGLLRESAHVSISLHRAESTAG